MVVLSTIVLAVAAGYHVTHRKNAALRKRWEHRAEERDRVARELQDTLLQGVQGLMLHVHAAVRYLAPADEARVLLERALSLADELVGQGGERVGRLRSERSPSANLAEAFEVIATELNEQSDASISVVTVNEPRSFHPTAVEEIYFIGRDVLMSTYRSSSATMITVRLEYRPAAFRVVVIDDGHGLGLAAAAAGAGVRLRDLDGIARRASRIGGSLTSEARPNRGSIVTLDVPARAAYADRGSLWSRVSRPIRTWLPG